MKNVKLLWAIAGALLYVVIVASIGAFLVDTSSDWYMSLNMPKFMPPSIVFSIVWSIIYIITIVIMAEAIKNYDIKTIVLFVILGILNILYSAIFFRAESTIGGLIMTLLNFIIALLIFINGVKEGSKIIYLFLLALIWYGFAVALSYSIVILN